MKTMLSLTHLLFEAPVDVWLKRYGSEGIDRTELNRYAEVFKRYSAVIFNPDITAYSFDRLKTLAEVVELAKRYDLKALSIKWLTKSLFNKPSITTENIREDYIPLVRQYEKIKDQAKPPLDSFNSILNLHDYLGEHQVDSNIPAGNEDEELDIFHQDEEWQVAMPHTTEASCELGKGTTWCTARTDSQNLFLSYMGRGEDINLFYVIKKGGNPRSNPWDKMSVGFIKKAIKFNQGDGNISVNAKNQNLTQQKFFEVLGPERAVVFLKAMSEKAKQTPVHPAAKEMALYASNLELFKVKLASFKDRDAKLDLAGVVVENSSLTPEVLDYLLSEEEYKAPSDVYFNTRKIAQTSTNMDILNLLVDKHLAGWFGWLVLNESLGTSNLWKMTKYLAETKIMKLVVSKYFGKLMFNPEFIPQMLDFVVGKMSEDLKNDQKLATDILVYENSTKFNTKAVGEMFARSDNWEIRRWLAENKHTNPEVLVGLTQDTEEQVAEEALRNPSLPDEVYFKLLAQYGNDDSIDNNKSIAMMRILLSSPKVPLETLQKFQNSYYFQLQRAVFNNPKSEHLGVQTESKLPLLSKLLFIGI